MQLHRESQTTSKGKKIGHMVTRTDVCRSRAVNVNINLCNTLGYIFAQSALLYAFLFVIMNIYPVYAKG